MSYLSALAKTRTLQKIVLLVFLVAFVGLAYILATQYTTGMRQEPLTFQRPVHVDREPQLNIDKEPQLNIDKEPELNSDREPKQELQLTDAAKFRLQRDELSRQLNLMKKAYGQQSCEQLKVLKEAGKLVESRVSENGGWCSETSSPQSSSHMWDKGFSTALSSFLKGKKVASFGDGPGMYKKHVDSVGEVKSYTAYDGAPFCENVTGGLVKFLDLTAPQYGLPAYDWVVSVEVGEHIPAKYENIYLDNLVRHAKEGIILSWAVPGQSGLSHVNNKPLVDVVAQMNKRGFEIDIDAGQPLRSSSTFKWLKGNIHVYYRSNAQTFVYEDA